MIPPKSQLNSVHQCSKPLLLDDYNRGFYIIITTQYIQYIGDHDDPIGGGPLLTNHYKWIFHRDFVATAQLSMERGHWKDPHPLLLDFHEKNHETARRFSVSPLHEKKITSQNGPAKTSGNSPKPSWTKSNSAWPGPGPALARPLPLRPSPGSPSSAARTQPSPCPTAVPSLGSAACRCPSRGHRSCTTARDLNWLVGQGHPSEKYERQLGWLETQYMGK